MLSLQRFALMVGVAGSIGWMTFAGGLLGCTKKQPAPSGAPLTAAQLLEQGKKVYQLNCLSCHAADPRQEGSVGPAIAGSSLELITARVLSVSYPAGYKPKRTTGIMIALPHLKNDLPALQAYLNSF